MNKLPLDGIRVLDLTRAYAGTLGTLYLADLGADVIKVEAVTRPDIPTREMNPAELDPGNKPWERAAYFHRLNVGKRDITLDLTTDTGIDLFKQLVPHCDVVTENYNPQTMRRFGLHYEALKKLNPRIIMASMSGFGADGPRKSWAAYYPAMESMAGLTAITGYETGETLTSLTGYGDWTLGTVGAMAILAAIHYRNETGEGQYIDISGREAVLAAIGDAMTDLSLNGRAWKPSGNSHFYMAPHDTYRCRSDESDNSDNNWVAIAVRDQQDWEAFCTAIGSPDWTLDEQFTDQGRRHANQEIMRPLIEAWTILYTKREAADLLLKAGVPAGPVLDPGETLFDAQLRSRDYYEVIDHPEVGSRLFPRQVPAHYSTINRQARTHPPLLGEHNHQVLGKLLGLDVNALKDLEESGAIGTEPSRKSRRPPEVTREKMRKRGAKADDDYLEKLTTAYGQKIGPP